MSGYSVALQPTVKRWSGIVLDNSTWHGTSLEFRSRLVRLEIAGGAPGCLVEMLSVDGDDLLVGPVPVELFAGIGPSRLESFYDELPSIEPKRLLLVATTEPVHAVILHLCAVSQAAPKEVFL